MIVSIRTRAIEAAANELCSMLKFVSANSSDVREGLMRLLDRMASADEDEAMEQLAWFRQVVIDHYDEWPGPRTLRAMWCTRYLPADREDAALMDGPYRAKLDQRAITAHEDNMRLLPRPDESEEAQFAVDLVARLARQKGF